jgi:riboflavin synthase
MYTGIVQGAFEAVEVHRKPDFMSFAIQFPPELLEDLGPGTSVNIDGVCQTVVKVDGKKVWFDAMIETLRRTTLGQLEQGDPVNVERSARVGQENGGHEIAGHVDGMLEIIEKHESEDNLFLTFRVPQEYRRYIFDKGFLSVHGCSLTVTNFEREAGTFEVYLIPETVRLTNLGSKQVGDRINFEIDRRTQAVVDTVIGYLDDNLAKVVEEVGGSQA